MGVPVESSGGRISRTIILLAFLGTIIVACSSPAEPAQAAGRGGPCFTGFPDAKSRTQGGVTSYNFQKSVRMVACEEFGRTVRFDFTPSVTCAIISVAAGEVVRKTGLFIGGACDGGTLATDSSRQARLGVACDYLSALLGVRYRALGQLTGLACASAPSVGASIEAKHEFNIARDVLLKRKCIRYKAHSLGSPWSAVNCAAGDKGFRSLPRPGPSSPAPNPNPDPNPGGGGGPESAGAPGIATGYAHTCAIATGGKVKCWGEGTSLGSIENLIGPNSAVPIPVTANSGYPGFVATSISASGAYTCAVTTNPDVRCWGGFSVSGPTDEGPSGYSTGSGGPVQEWPLASPTAVSVGGTSYRGLGHVCAVEEAGTVRCWGNNSYGELGDGTTTSTSFMRSPRYATGISDATDVASGATYTCALHTAGTVSCWGTYGPLGFPANPFDPPRRQLTPAVVPGISDAVQISAGESHICALLESGAIDCWGANSYGQLGTGDTNYTTTPSQVEGITDATSVSAGASQTCAVLADGRAECWGGVGNSYRALGDDSGAGSATPVRVSGISNAASISVSSDYHQHACALLDDGSARCWGEGPAGQLGNGRFDDSPLAVSVSGFPG